MWTLFTCLILSYINASNSFFLDKYPISCDDPSIIQDGIYDIYPDGVTQTKVYCDFSRGRWLRMLNKIDRSIGPFKQNFNAYQFGFGTPASNFWFGLENVRKMLEKGALELRIELNNGLHWIEYSSFYIGSEAQGYALTVIHNKTGNLFDIFSRMNGYKFYWYQTSTELNTFSAGWWFYPSYSVCLTCEITLFDSVQGHWYNNTVPWLVSSNNKMYIRPKNRIFAKNCYEIYKAGRRVNGIYVIYLDANNKIPTKVYCEMNTGGWTRILSRDSTSFSFVKSIDEYTAGFGDAALNNSWFGLNNLHTITNKEMFQLRIELTNSAGSTFFIVYDMFFLGPESDGYRLYLGKKVFGSLDDALAASNGKKFANVDYYDSINDGMCTLINKGGWWYDGANNCFQGCLTCLLTTPVWSSQNAILAGAQPDLKFSKIKMMIRQVAALKDEEQLIDPENVS